MGDNLLDALEKGCAEHVTHALHLPSGEAPEGERAGEPWVEVLEIRAFAEGL
jgi:hypothetical protein